MSESCNALLEIGDDYGDNSSGMHCQLEKGHEGLHQEKYVALGDNHVTITWENDERIKDFWYCQKCLEKSRDSGNYRSYLRKCDPCDFVYCVLCGKVPKDCHCQEEIARELKRSVEDLPEDFKFER